VTLYRIGERTTVEVGWASVVTRFDDGTKVVACPEHTELERARACALGYPNTWEMTRHHDLLHSILAYSQGLDVSPVLWAVAHDLEVDADVARAEEGAVLLLQRLTQVGLAPILAERSTPCT
jgi:hypothetical protein